VLSAFGALAVTSACGQQSRAAAPRPLAGSPPRPRRSTQKPTPGATAAGTARGPAQELDSGSRTGSLVALTFHGQGDPALTNALLAQAEQAKASVTVFAIGSWLAAHPTTARRIISGGHELANHTQRHLPMAAMGETAAYAEFAQCADVLRRLTGSPGRWVRPSGTPHATAAVRAAAGRAGYRVCVGYDVDSLDYTDPGPQTVRRRCAVARPGSIVSLHLGHPDTVAALPGVLSDLRRAGLRPVTLSTLLGPR